MRDGDHVRDEDGTTHLLLWRRPGCSEVMLNCEPRGVQEFMHKVKLSNEQITCMGCIAWEHLTWSDVREPDS